MILIVEDDLEIQMILKEYLELKNYQVKQAYNIKEALNIMNSEIYLIIIDIQLPDGNGITLCNEIRTLYNTPIIFLTALLDEDTIVEALNNGGDDYIKKPFHMRELLARIESVSRRIKKNEEKLKIDDLYIDMDQYIVKKQNNIIELSSIGYEILFLLIRNRGRVVTRGRMIEFIEEKTGNFIEDNTVSVHIKRLREKIDNHDKESYIETIRGIGYRWRQK